MKKSAPALLINVIHFAAASSASAPDEAVKHAPKNSWHLASLVAQAVAALDAGKGSFESELTQFLSSSLQEIAESAQLMS